jgi:hypothetical protein
VFTYVTSILTKDILQTSSQCERDVTSKRNTKRGSDKVSSKKGTLTAPLTSTLIHSSIYITLLYPLFPPLLFTSPLCSSPLCSPQLLFFILIDCDIILLYFLVSQTVSQPISSDEDSPHDEMDDEDSEESSTDMRKLKKHGGNIPSTESRTEEDWMSDEEENSAFPLLRIMGAVESLTKKMSLVISKLDSMEVAIHRLEKKAEETNGSVYMNPETRKRQRTLYSPSGVPISNISSSPVRSLSLESLPEMTKYYIRICRELSNPHSDVRVSLLL